MSDLEKNVLEVIKQERIQPIPRWHFVVRRSLQWFAGGLFVLLGAVTSSIVLLKLNLTEWDIFRYYQDSFWNTAFTIIPIIWLLGLLFFLILSVWQIQKTGHAYRWRPIAHLSVAVLLSILFGAAIYYSGLAEKLEDGLRNNIPTYEKMHCRAVGKWMNPEQGLLMGTIQEVLNKSNQATDFVLIDIYGEAWLIKAEQARWRGGIKAASGEPIRVIGQIKDQETFIATELRPWPGSGKRQRLSWQKQRQSMSQIRWGAGRLETLAMLPDNHDSPENIKSDLHSNNP